MEQQIHLKSCSIPMIHENEQRNVSEINNSRIVKQLKPSLSRLATVKIAFNLFMEYDIETLETAFAAIQQQSSRSSNENNITLRFNRLNESLLAIPGHLRSCVLHAVRGLNQDFLDFRKEHPYIKPDKCSLPLRSDGTFDRNKMALQIAADVSIGIRERYHTAFMYSISEMIPTLWAEMVASGHLENVDLNRSMLAFTLPNGSLAPWIQLPPPPSRNNQVGKWYPRFSECYRNLPKQSRLFVLTDIKNFSNDDFLQLMRYVVTREEEKKILQTQARRILLLHLKWPLQSLFLQTAEKIWNFLDIKSFHHLLRKLLLLKKLEKDGLQDYDYSSLFENFWDRSPSHLKESLKANRNFNRIINSYLGSTRGKEKNQ